MRPVCFLKETYKGDVSMILNIRIPCDPSHVWYGYWECFDTLLGLPKRHSLESKGVKLWKDTMENDANERESTPAFATKLVCNLHGFLDLSSCISKYSHIWARHCAVFVPWMAEEVCSSPQQLHTSLLLFLKHIIGYFVHHGICFFHARPFGGENHLLRGRKRRSTGSVPSGQTSRSWNV